MKDFAAKHGHAPSTASTNPTKGSPKPASSLTRSPNAGSEWRALSSLFPYLWAYRWRVLAALAFMVGAKLANVGVPVALKEIVDHLTIGQSMGQSAQGQNALQFALLAVPLGAIAAYGLLRLSTTLFTELREIVFARVTQSAVHAIALKVFSHLHGLSLRFHLERQTGGLTRDIERGTRAVSSLVSYSLYSILPTLIEISLVLAFLVWKYEIWFAVITVSALVLYILWTILITEWRTHFRRQMNDLDSKANVRAIDSLLNFETVKYFNNEKFEAQRYDESLRKWMNASLKSQSSLSMLNLGQSLIIAVAVTLMVWRATVGVVEGRMTLGDLVLVNAFMIQLYIPLNFLGVLYREIKQGLTDLEKLFGLLEENQDVADRPGAQTLVPKPGGALVEFRDVIFSYDGQRRILDQLNINIQPGQRVAIVGQSGVGKSTLARLLFRFYDVQEGQICFDGIDLRDLTQSSLRNAIGIVPQDTVLFNDTIAYNIAYGRPGASQAEIDQAAQAAQLTDFIASLPDGYQTMVGERGLKLSGGEKQRVAIARMILKNPAVVILDEATSALDSRNEQAIQGALEQLANNRTTIVIAHRLSTIVDADQIIVMERGRVLEAGRHDELLAKGERYSQMWAAQTQEAES